MLDQLRPNQLAGSVTDALAAALGRAFPPEEVAQALEAIHFRELLAGSINTLAIVALLLLVIGGLEFTTSRYRAPYRSRVFARDLLYALFYHGRFYKLLIWAAVANALENQLAFMRVDALASLPTAVHVAIYWLFADFVHYWVHRAEHKFEFLWAIHSVHHTQDEMTFVSTYRMHPLEALLNNLVMVVPLLVLGVPTQHWVAVSAVLLAFDALQHSALDWTYGRAYPIVVSPRFHALHHSTQPQQYNGNYSKILSIWDYMFGTAVWSDRRPERIGVDGMPLPQSLFAQLMAPFQLMGKRLRRVGAVPVGP
jgi:sterol desaturase/sphingolipid hydroxylase (fatty acid hydroxylase superfamily)